MFGISFENMRNLASVQETVINWSKGRCYPRADVSSAVDLPGANVLRIPSEGNSTPINNATHSHILRHLAHRPASDLHSMHSRHATQLDKRATCSYLTVASGDTCPTLVRKCGVSNADFVRYNPRSGLCAAGSLKAGDFVCCSAGDLPSAGVTAPKPGTDGVCATHLIQNGDTCTTLAKRYGVTAENLEKWNKKKTWAWTKCEDMLLGYNMCVSDGFAPMPLP
jgi:LysM repeat protein